MLENLKLWYVGCKISSEKELEKHLNKIFFPCNFKVNSGYRVEMRDESNFVKLFQFTIEKGVIINISGLSDNLSW